MTMIFVYIQTALKQLLKNKGRSVLTMLGIIIGIGSVIFILTIGQAAKGFLLGQITKFGTNVIEVAPSGSFGPFGGSDDAVLTDDDVKAVETSSLLPEITGISAGDSSVSRELTYQNESAQVSIFADRPEVFSVNNYKNVAGRFFNTSDMQNNARVVVVGEGLAEELFDSVQNAVGKEVKIGDALFTVIGVSEDAALGPGSFGTEVVYAPLTTIRQLFVEQDKQKEVTFMLVQFEQGTNVESFKNRLNYVITENHAYFKENPDQLTVVSREQALGIFTTILVGIQAFISAVAAISLMVGGIGIMNIMLVTVKERTKEIGLRKAIGAKNASILIQFLVESVVLTTIGGLIGVALGLSLSGLAVLAANILQPDWGVQFVVVPSAILLACGTAAIVGLIFGIYPAYKASKLHPIEALRYE
jgi:putative ABC transport system permease protein